MKLSNYILTAVLGLAAVMAIAAGAFVALLSRHDVPPPPVAGSDFARSVAAVPAPIAKPAAPAQARPGADSELVIKRILPIKGPIRYGEWHWDEKGVPAGPLVITVDLEARVLSIFRDGYEIGATAVLLGTSEKPTPLGVFPIRWKKKDHFSSTYDGAPMPYTMNLTEDGVSIHATRVEKGYASHGCIGVPQDFAARLFATVPVGTPVYVTRGKMVGIGDPLTGG